MIVRWYGDRDMSAAVRDQQLTEKRGQLADRLISECDLNATDTITLTITTRKKRNRSKDATIDEYILTGWISV